MELEFIAERLTVIRRLKGLSNTDIERKMCEIGGFKNRMNIDRWELGFKPQNFEKVKLLAQALEVPVGFFFYKNVRIDMKNLKVEIFIFDTNETIMFYFI